jgi:hypothetical protein
MKRVLSGILSLAIALPLAATLTTTNERAAAFATYADAEPSIATQMRNGVEHQVVAWMEFTQGIDSPARLKFNHFANGNASIGTLPALSGFTGRYADPWLTQNTSTATPLQRIYCFGVTTGASVADASAIVRWYSDNGGQTWSAAGVVQRYDRDASGNAADFWVDKPAATVSAHSGSAGYIYVTYVRRSRATNRTEIVVSVSTNGGSTWNGPYNVSGTTSVGGHFDPQIMVDNDDGSVWVVWTRTANGEIRIASNSAWTSSWSTTSTTLFTQQQTATVAGLYGGGAYVACGANCRLRAVSAPVARLDSTRNRIGVAWHRANGTGTVIDFRPFDTAGLTWGSTLTFWNGGHDLQPSMAFDSSGNYLVAWYAMGLNQPTYHNVANYISFSNGVPQAESLHLLSTTQSDVTALPVPALDTQGSRFLGEYHDVSFSNGTFKTVAIQVLSSANPYVYTTIHN